MTKRFGAVRLSPAQWAIVERIVATAEPVKIRSGDHAKRGGGPMDRRPALPVSDSGGEGGRDEFGSTAVEDQM